MFGHLWEGELTNRSIFTFKFTCLGLSQRRSRFWNFKGLLWFVIEINVFLAENANTSWLKETVKRNFTEIFHSSRCTTSVVDSGGKSSIIKVLIILFGHLWEVELTYRYIFAFKFTLRSQKPDIVPIISHLCQWHRWQICRRCRWYRWQIATGVVDTGGKFTTGIKNTSETGGKICHLCRWQRWQISHRCRWYRWRTLICEYISEFSKKFETVLMGYSGAGGKLIHEKNQKHKLVTLSL